MSESHPGEVLFSPKRLLGTRASVMQASGGTCGLCGAEPEQIFAQQLVGLREQAAYDLTLTLILTGASPGVTLILILILAP